MSLLTHSRITISVERDIPLRSHEYQVVCHDRKTGEEIQGFTFTVSDSGKQLVVAEPVDLR